MVVMIFKLLLLNSRAFSAHRIKLKDVCYSPRNMMMLLSASAFFIKFIESDRRQFKFFRRDTSDTNGENYGGSSLHSWRPNRGFSCFYFG